MNRPFTHVRLSVLMLVVSITGAAMAQTFDLSWHTISGGSGSSTGGGFEMSGTIGQPTAGSPLSGGSFTMAGGFWPGMESCTLPGDLNHDGIVDGADVQGFLNCLLTASGVNCGCADFNSGGVTASDVAPFVAALLGS